MTNELELLHGARPAVGGPSDHLVRDERRKLLAAIAAPTRRATRRRLAVPLALAVGVAAVAVVVLSQRSGGSAWAADLVRVADDAPRLLVDAPGWSVTRADEFSPGQGEMTFTDGSQTLDLSWNHAAANQAGYAADPSVELAGRAPAGGAQATVYRFVGVNDYVALWSSGGFAIQARASAPDLSSFVSLLGALHSTDVDGWLSAMPASVVAPDSRPRVVTQMLAGVPTPPGFDVGALTRGDAVRDRYQLGAQVAGTVACGWIGRWVDAKRNGDAAAAHDATTALATSHHWQVLLGMTSEGAYPQVLWQYADAVAGDGTVLAGKRLTVAESYRQALGCGS